MKDSGRRKIRFLTGAPSSSSLQWDDWVLTAPLQECFAAATPKRSEIRLSDSHAAETAGPRWRSLPLEREHLPTGFTQLTKAEERLVGGDEGFATSETSFLVATDLALVSAASGENASQGLRSSPAEVEEAEEDEGGDLLTQFYEHSLAVCDNVTSSQALEYESMNETSNSTSFDDSYIESQLLHGGSSPGKALAKTRLSSSYLTNLARVPNAAYIEAIAPQTKTVNLVLGIISIPQPRVIKARRSGQIFGLVEMLVGDETKAGFGITIWLSDPQNPNEKESDLQTEVARLRPQDIVLARNIALNSFQGKVYGQSLRRNMTTLDLLYRNQVDATDRGGAFGVRELLESEGNTVQFSKVKRVRQWVMDFVGAGTILPQTGLTKTPGAHRRHQLQELPPDTQ
ncbi:hypothetical protein MMC07_001812 [Pseudocyphellaria aurata]|nr:hypothetical protein [Pseudocyphellaria aurata]